MNDAATDSKQIEITFKVVRAGRTFNQRTIAHETKVKATMMRLAGDGAFAIKIRGEARAFAH